MSAISPFRKDAAVAAATERVPYEFEELERGGERVYSCEATGPPFAEAAMAEPEAEEREDEFEHRDAEAGAVFAGGPESVAELELWQSDLEDGRALPEAASAASIVQSEEEEEEEVVGETAAWATEVTEEGTVIPEELEAVDPFPPAERRSLARPLMAAAVSAKAVAWNAAQHPGVSGVAPAAIRTALGSYVDLSSVQAEIEAANAEGAGIALGVPPVDAVLVEAVHQFQRKCYTEPKQADGLVGESTLDSLGIVSTSPKFNTVDRVHDKTRRALRRAAEQIETETGGRYTADNWFEHMVNPAFLGRTFTNGIHAVLAAKLRMAERHLLAQPGFKGKTPAALGQALQIAEQHRGARPHRPDSSSVHTAGLAVDINYTGNPWIAGNPDAPVGNRHFTDVVDRAALLVGGAVLRAEERLTSAFLDGLSSRPTSEIYARLELFDRYFRGYFALDGALDAIRVRLLAHRLQLHTEALRLIFHTGEDVDAAARRWLEQIRKDRNALKGGNFGKGREPRHGFLNLHKELVVALRDAAGLAWGAVDFGPRQSGDVMHFDCRRDGVGRIVAKALGKAYLAPEPAAYPWGAWGGEVAVADEAPPKEGETLALDGDVASFEESEGFFGTATAAIRDAWDAIKTRARIANGVVKENQLTNLVFFDRHPERGGRELSPSEPDFATLRAEWLDIQTRIVRPALFAARSARYDRAGALAYARKFWLRVCDDEFIALGGKSGKNFVKVDAATRFEHEFEADGVTPKPREHAVLPDGSEIPWEHLDDCTHFISCCIGERPGEACGGLKIPYRQLGSPPTAPYGIVRVGTMVDFLTGRLRSDIRYAEIVAEKSEDDSVVNQLAPGDLIAYFHKGRSFYSHMALLLEGGKIACHTYGRSDQPACTWDNSWDLGRGTHQWTFIRFVV